MEEEIYLEHPVNLVVYGVNIWSPSQQIRKRPPLGFEPWYEPFDRRRFYDSSGRLRKWKNTQGTPERTVTLEYGNELYVISVCSLEQYAAVMVKYVREFREWTKHRQIRTTTETDWSKPALVCMNYSKYMREQPKWAKAPTNGEFSAATRKRQQKRRERKQILSSLSTSSIELSMCNPDPETENVKLNRRGWFVHSSNSLKQKDHRRKSARKTGLFARLWNIFKGKRSKTGLYLRARKYLLTSDDDESGVPCCFGRKVIRKSTRDTHHQNISDGYDEDGDDENSDDGWASDVHLEKRVCKFTRKSKSLTKKAKKSEGKPAKKDNIIWSKKHTDSTDEEDSSTTFSEDEEERSQKHKRSSVKVGISRKKKNKRNYFTKNMKKHLSSRTDIHENPKEENTDSNTEVDSIDNKMGEKMQNMSLNKETTCMSDDTLHTSIHDEGSDVLHRPLPKVFVQGEKYKEKLSQNEKAYGYSEDVAFPKDAQDEKFEMIKEASQTKKIEEKSKDQKMTVARQADESNKDTMLGDSACGSINDIQTYNPQQPPEKSFFESAKGEPKLQNDIVSMESLKKSDDDSACGSESPVIPKSPNHEKTNEENNDDDTKEERDRKQITEIKKNLGSNEDTVFGGRLHTTINGDDFDALQRPLLTCLLKEEKNAENSKENEKLSSKRLLIAKSTIHYKTKGQIKEDSKAKKDIDKSEDEKKETKQVHFANKDTIFSDSADGSSHDREPHDDQQSNGESFIVALEKQRDMNKSRKEREPKSGREAGSIDQLNKPDNDSSCEIDRLLVCKYTQHKKRKDENKGEDTDVCKDQKISEVKQILMLNKEPMSGDSMHTSSLDDDSDALRLNKEPMSGDSLYTRSLDDNSSCEIDRLLACKDTQHKKRKEENKGEDTDVCKDQKISEVKQILRLNKEPMSGDSLHTSSLDEDSDAFEKPVWNASIQEKKIMEKSNQNEKASGDASGFVIHKSVQFEKIGEKTKEESLSKIAKEKSEDEKIKVAKQMLASSEDTMVCDCTDGISYKEPHVLQQPSEKSLKDFKKQGEELNKLNTKGDPPSGNDPVTMNKLKKYDESSCNSDILVFPKSVQQKKTENKTKEENKGEIAKEGCKDETVRNEKQMLASNEDTSSWDSTKSSGSETEPCDDQKPFKKSVFDDWKKQDEISKSSKKEEPISEQDTISVDEMRKPDADSLCAHFQKQQEEIKELSKKGEPTSEKGTVAMDKPKKYDDSSCNSEILVFPKKVQAKKTENMTKEGNTGETAKEESKDEKVKEESPVHVLKNKDTSSWDSAGISGSETEPRDTRQPFYSSLIDGLIKQEKNVQQQKTENKTKEESKGEIAKEESKDEKVKEETPMHVSNADTLSWDSTDSTGSETESHDEQKPSNNLKSLFDDWKKQEEKNVQQQKTENKTKDENKGEITKEESKDEKVKEENQMHVSNKDILSWDSTDSSSSEKECHDEQKPSNNLKSLFDDWKKQEEKNVPEKKTENKTKDENKGEITKEESKDEKVKEENQMHVSNKDILSWDSTDSSSSEKECHDEQKPSNNLKSLFDDWKKQEEKNVPEKKTENKTKDENKGEITKEESKDEKVKEENQMHVSNKDTLSWDSTDSSGSETELRGEQKPFNNLKSLFDDWKKQEEKNVHEKKTENKTKDEKKGEIAKEESKDEKVKEENQMHVSNKDFLSWDSTDSSGSETEPRDNQQPFYRSFINDWKTQQEENDKSSEKEGSVSEQDTISVDEVKKCDVDSFYDNEGLVIPTGSQQGKAKDQNKDNTEDSKEKKIRKESLRSKKDTMSSESLHVTIKDTLYEDSTDSSSTNIEPFGPQQPAKESDDSSCDSEGLVTPKGQRDGTVEQKLNTRKEEFEMQKRDADEDAKTQAAAAAEVPSHQDHHGNLNKSDQVDGVFDAGEDDGDQNKTIDTKKSVPDGKHKKLNLLRKVLTKFSEKKKESKEDSAASKVDNIADDVEKTSVKATDSSEEEEITFVKKTIPKPKIKQTFLESLLIDKKNTKEYTDYLVEVHLEEKRQSAIKSKVEEMRKQFEVENREAEESSGLQGDAAPKLTSDQKYHVKLYEKDLQEGTIDVFDEAKEKSVSCEVKETTEAEAEIVENQPYSSGDEFLENKTTCVREKIEKPIVPKRNLIQKILTKNPKKTKKYKKQMAAYKAQKKREKGIQQKLKVMRENFEESNRKAEDCEDTPVGLTSHQEYYLNIYEKDLRDGIFDEDDNDNGAEKNTEEPTATNENKSTDIKKSVPSQNEKKPSLLNKVLTKFTEKKEESKEDLVAPKDGIFDEDDNDNGAEKNTEEPTATNENKSTDIKKSVPSQNGKKPSLLNKVLTKFTEKKEESKEDLVAPKDDPIDDNVEKTPKKATDSSEEEELTFVQKTVPQPKIKQNFLEYLLVNKKKTREYKEYLAAVDAEEERQSTINSKVEEMRKRFQAQNRGADESGELVGAAAAPKLTSDQEYYVKLYEKDLQDGIFDIFDEEPKAKEESASCEAKETTEAEAEIVEKEPYSSGDEFLENKTTCIREKVKKPIVTKRNLLDKILTKNPKKTEKYKEQMAAYLAQEEKEKEIQQKLKAMREKFEASNQEVENCEDMPVGLTSKQEYYLNLYEKDLRDGIFDIVDDEAKEAEAESVENEENSSGDEFLEDNTTCIREKVKKPIVPKRNLLDKILTKNPKKTKKYQEQMAAYLEQEEKEKEIQQKLKAMREEFDILNRQAEPRDDTPVKLSPKQKRDLNTYEKELRAKLFAEDDKDDSAEINAEKPTDTSKENISAEKPTDTSEENKPTDIKKSVPTQKQTKRSFFGKVLTKFTEKKESKEDLAAPKDTDIADDVEKTSKKATDSSEEETTFEQKIRPQPEINENIQEYEPVNKKRSRDDKENLTAEDAEENRQRRIRDRIEAMRKRFDAQNRAAAKREDLVWTIVVPIVTPEQEQYLKLYEQDLQDGMSDTDSEANTPRSFT